MGQLDWPEVDCKQPSGNSGVTPALARSPTLAQYQSDSDGSHLSHPTTHVRGSPQQDSAGHDQVSHQQEGGGQGG